MRANAVGRTSALLRSVDQYAREGGDTDADSLPRDLLALRHLVECLTRIVRQYPPVAEYAEFAAARAAEALDLVEVES